MSDAPPPVRPSTAIRAIRRLPFGQRLALRLYNRLFMHFGPRRIATTYFGARMRVDTRDFLQATIFHYGTWEPNISAALAGLLRPGDSVVDIGANVGYYSLLFAGRVGPAGKVIAIEPHPRFAAIAQANVRLNGLGNVRLEEVAVAAGAGEILLYEGPRSNGGSTTILAHRGLAPTYRVPARTLMSILSGDDVSRITLIKIDIEGAEAPVLREVLHNIGRFGPRLSVAVEVNPADDPAWPELFAAFIAHGFSAVRLRNDYRWEVIDQEARAPHTDISSMPGEVCDILFSRG